jgi:malate dehydrogenase
MGSHGDTMVPVISKTFVSGKPISSVLSNEKIGSIVKRTCDRGAEIVSLLGTGSAYYSPSAAVLSMIKAIIGDEGKVITASVYLEGEYGLKDIFMGAPCRIGRCGVAEVVELDLSEQERSAFSKSAIAVKSSIEHLRDSNLLQQTTTEDGA